MRVNRRQLLMASAAAGVPICFGPWSPAVSSRQIRSVYVPPPAFGIQPVIFDGKWNWKDPPADETGYLDGRDFEVAVGVSWTGTGTATNLQGSTVAPVAFPEQKVLDVKIEKSEGCAAQLQKLSDGAGQLQAIAPRLERGQVISARAVYKLRISRVCLGYDRDRFPASQSVTQQMAAQALGNSPGIRADLRSVQVTADEITSRYDHPWDKAKKFYEWVWENIRGVTGPYTSVKTAMENRSGDCEERAGVFIALCRAAGIPARLVWIPNHSWAEFCLNDEQGQPHWIPSHTAAYNWFGWTGAHEVVLQKGDRIQVPGPNRTQRLIGDWYSFKGRRPKIEFTGSIKPLAPAGQDPGPGKRNKDAQGAWNLVGDHPDDKIIRV